jgi:hypothetical protein
LTAFNILIKLDGDLRNIQANFNPLTTLREISQRIPAFVSAVTSLAAITPTRLGPHGLHAIVFFMVKHSYIMFLAIGNDGYKLPFSEAMELLEIYRPLTNTLMALVSSFRSNIPRVLYEVPGVRALREELEKKRNLLVVRRLQIFTSFY